MAFLLQRLLRTRGGSNIGAWLNTLPNADEWSEWRDIWVLSTQTSLQGSVIVTIRRYCNICGPTRSVLGCIHDFVLRHIFHTAVVNPILERALRGPIDPSLQHQFYEASVDASNCHLRLNKRLDMIHHRHQTRSLLHSNLLLEEPKGRNPFIESLYRLEAGRRQLARAVREFLSYAVLADWSVDDLDPWIEEVYGYVPPGVRLVQRSIEEIALNPKKLELALMKKLHWCHERGSSNHRGSAGNPELDAWLDHRVTSSLNDRTMFWVPPTSLASLVTHAMETFDWYGASIFVIVTDNISTLDDPVPLPEWKVFPIYDELCCTFSK